MINEQMSIFEVTERYSVDDALDNIVTLHKMWKSGVLGGDFMPEDSNPHLPNDSEEAYLYFTLPMALNYQRNSYKLWESALATYLDPKTNFVFDPKLVVNKSTDEIRTALTTYKLALQQNKHTEIWKTLCNTIAYELDGSIKNLFSKCHFCVMEIIDYIQESHKKDFPYLSGNKIANYWLYVMINYTDLSLIDRENISVAPDTHVIKSSYMLGLIDNIKAPSVQADVANGWKKILADSELKPIDVHTPMWLWSRSNFVSIKEYKDGTL